jgi:RNA polymerase sigma-70 factor (ECF subfamily)
LGQIPSIAQPLHTDEELLAAFSNPSEKENAFTLLINRDQKKIYWFIRRMVIDHEDANDLVQDVFIKVWNGISSFRNESSITHWIYRIAMNVTLTFLDRKKRKYDAVSLDDAEGELRNKLYSGKYIDGDKIQLKLQEAILTLPEKQRIVFQLRYYDEMPYEEMSGLLDTSEGALKASYHHAAKKIEEFMKMEA